MARSASPGGRAPRNPHAPVPLRWLLSVASWRGTAVQPGRSLRIASLARRWSAASPMACSASPGGRAPRNPHAPVPLRWLLSVASWRMTAVLDRSRAPRNPHAPAPLRWLLSVASWRGTEAASPARCLRQLRSGPQCLPGGRPPDPRGAPGRSAVWGRLRLRGITPACSPQRLRLWLTRDAGRGPSPRNPTIPVLLRSWGSGGGGNEGNRRGAARRRFELALRAWLAYGTQHIVVTYL